ncbi:MAG TPA: hypothetical protein VNE62_11880 [Actinomycetota bacterium]|nr:hypothetical protein [Actinomycetota bacterium]
MGKTARTRTTAVAAIMAVAVAAATPASGRQGAESHPLFPDLVKSATGICGSLYEIGSTGLCTHGPDETHRLPGGHGTARSGEPALGDPTSGGTPSGTVPCDGDGTSGKRIHAIYMRASTEPDRYEEVLPSIRGWGAEMNRIVEQSSLKTQGMRRLRFVTDASCNLVVSNVTVTPTAVTSFASMVEQLRARGFNNNYRKYAIWFDTVNPGLCGIGTAIRDDRPALDNLSNNRVGYGRSDTRCWGRSEIHEVMHNLGAVQNSAPHSTGFAHCTDENDIMCYQDEPTTQITTLCPDPLDQRILDCGNDDYFSTAPGAGTYLATHWNTANSGWMTAVSSGPPDTTVVSGPPALTRFSSAAFRFSSTQPRSTFTCSLDGAEASACSAAPTFTGLAEGAHRLEVAAANEWSAIDETPAAHTWTVDLTAPSTFFTTTPPLRVYRYITFRFASDDAAARFKCSLDGGRYYLCSSPTTYRYLTKGYHSVRIAAIDAAGNADPTPLLHRFRIY